MVISHCHSHQLEEAVGPLEVRVYHQHHTGHPSSGDDIFAFAECEMAVELEMEAVVDHSQVLPNRGCWMHCHHQTKSWLYQRIYQDASSSCCWRGMHEHDLFGPSLI